MLPIELASGEILSNQQLSKIFLCSTQGGMRRSYRTNSLILICNHTKDKYQDRWIDGVLHYCGMGLVGDQSLNSKQNKTLNESRTNGVHVHLFEVTVPNQYEYKGLVSLYSDPYPKAMPDIYGNYRVVWVFPLIVLD